MSFDLKVQIDTSDAKGKPAEVASELDKMTAAEGRANDGAKKLAGGMTELGEALGISTKASAGLGDATDKATGLTGRQLKILQQINAPAKEYAAQLEAIKGLLDLGSLSTAQYEQQLIRLQRATGVTAGIEAQAAIALERQAAVYERIRGPMQRYEADMAALDALMQQGKVTAIEYEAEFQKLAASYGTMHGPVAPQNVTAPAEGDGGASALGRGLGTAASLLTGGAIGAGVVGLTHQISDLVEKFHDLDDVAIKATNHALKFADASRTTTQIVDEQLEMARRLNTQYSKTIELYDTVRSGTDNLNISRKDQLKLEESIGKIYQISNGSLDGATGFMNRFSYAMAAGSINAHTLAGMMKQASDIGDLWVSHFKTDRDGLLAMVRAGTVTVEDLGKAIMEEGKVIDANFAKRTAQHADIMAQYKEEDAILAKRYDTSAGGGHAAQQTVDAMKAAAAANPAVYAELQRTADSNFLTAWGNDQVKLAKEALAQIKDESTRAWTDWFNDVKNLTGPFQDFGDRYRKFIGDTQAVRNEVTKLNEPIEAARVEIETLSRAFETGQLGVQEYTKQYIALQTTINHGLTPEVFRYSQPIDEAKRSLDDLKKATEANTVSGEYARKRYDELLTTLNDGRLPSTIKLWESWTLPIRDIGFDIAGLNALFRAGRIDADRYNAELLKLRSSIPVDEAAALRRLSDGASGRGIVGPRRFGDQDVSVGFEQGGGKQQRDQLAPLSVQGDVQASIAAVREETDATRVLNQQLERQRALASEFVAPAVAYEQALKDIAGAQQTWGITQEQAIVLQRRAKSAYNDAMEALSKARGPLEQYQSSVRKLNDQLEAGEVSQKKYSDGLDQARVAYLQATGAAETFKGAIEIEWIKMTGEADAFGASVEKVAVSGFGKLNDSLIDVLNNSGKYDEQRKELQQQLAAGKISQDEYAKSVDQIGVNWGNVANSIIEDLERIALKMLEVKLIQAGIGLFSGGGGAAAAAGGSVMNNLSGFATGGSFVVGGDGGTDTTPVAFRATRGERVTITPPGAYPSMGNGGHPGAAVPTASSGQTVNKIINVIDRNYGLAAIDSRGGHQAVVNVLRANQGAIRSYSGTRR